MNIVFGKTEKAKEIATGVLEMALENLIINYVKQTSICENNFKMCGSRNEHQKGQSQIFKSENPNIQGSFINEETKFIGISQPIENCNNSNVLSEST